MRLSGISTVVLTLFAIMVSCDGKIDRYSDFHQLPETGWTYGDTVKFRLCGNGLSEAGTMKVAVRHNDEFMYRNLWVEICYVDSAGNACVDSVNIELAGPLGRWKGKGIGASYQCESRVGHAVAVSDSSEVCVRHIMRLDTVRGIEQIGVTIE